MHWISLFKQNHRQTTLPCILWNFQGHGKLGRPSKVSKGFEGLQSLGCTNSNLLKFVSKHFFLLLSLWSFVLFSNFCAAKKGRESQFANWKWKKYLQTTIQNLKLLFKLRSLFELLAVLFNFGFRFYNPWRMNKWTSQQVTVVTQCNGFFLFIPDFFSDFCAWYLSLLEEISLKCWI